MKPRAPGAWTVEHISLALRVGSWCSTRLVNGEARACLCLRLGAALASSAQRRTAVGRGRGRRTLWRAVGWSALAPAARALLRLVAGRFRPAGAGWGGWRRVY